MPHFLINQAVEKLPFVLHCFFLPAFFFVILLSIFGKKHKSKLLWISLIVGWYFVNQKYDLIPLLPEKSVYHWFLWIITSFLLLQMIDQKLADRYPSHKGVISWLISLVFVCVAARIQTGYVSEDFTPLKRAVWMILMILHFIVWKLALETRLGNSSFFASAFHLSFSILLSTVVIIYSHSAKLMDIALLPGFALLWMSLLQIIIPALNFNKETISFSLFLPGIMLATSELSYSEIPSSIYLLVAASPLGVFIYWLFLNRKIPVLGFLSSIFTPWQLCLIIISLPLGIAIAVVFQVESLLDLGDNI